MAVKDIIKHYRDEQLLYFGEGLWSLKIPRIPTNIFAIDLLTGGGLPQGRASEFYGVKGSTKTTTALRAAGRYLLLNPTKKVLFVDFEGSFDVTWASNFIADMERFLLLTPDYGEQGLDIIRDLVLKAPEIGLLIIDSIAMMIPVKESQADAGDSFMGLQARLINRLYRMLLPIVTQKKREKEFLTILTINQLRANLKATGFQSPVMKAGGYLHDHILSLALRFYTVKFIQEKGIPAKSIHEFTVEKNKLGLQRRSGRFIMNLVNMDGKTPVGSIDELTTIIEFAKKSRVLERVGNKWKLGEIIYPTLEKAEEDCGGKPELLKTIKEEILQRCYKNILLTSGTTKTGEKEDDA